jgi:hypothetical protein
VTGQLAFDDCTPNWRDEPEALDRLCDAGAQQLHGPDGQRRDIRTINPPPEYL